MIQMPRHIEDVAARARLYMRQGRPLGLQVVRHSFSLSSSFIPYPLSHYPLSTHTLSIHPLSIHLSSPYSLLSSHFTISSAFQCWSQERGEESAEYRKQQVENILEVYFESLSMLVLTWSWCWYWCWILELPNCWCNCWCWRWWLECWGWGVADAKERSNRCVILRRGKNNNDPRLTLLFIKYCKDNDDNDLLSDATWL